MSTIEEDIQKAKLTLYQSGIKVISWDDGGISVLDEQAIEWYARDKNEKGDYEIGKPQHQLDCLKVVMKALNITDPHEAMNFLLNNSSSSKK